MDEFRITYIFRFQPNRADVFDIRLDATNMTLLNQPSGELPYWTRLSFQQCPHCPLGEAEYLFCPVAASLVEVAKRFEAIASYDEIDVEVVMPDRGVIGHTTAQRGISSMLGVLFPASGCPHTAFFRPMVRFHLPLATEADTIFRAGGMYLLAQYFMKKQHLIHSISFEGLERIYNNLNLVNMNMADRLRHAEHTESSVNAIVLLDVFTQIFPVAIDSQLEDIRYLFTPYIDSKSFRRSDGFRAGDSIS